MVRYISAAVFLGGALLILFAFVQLKTENSPTRTILPERVAQPEKKDLKQYEKMFKKWKLCVWPEMKKYKGNATELWRAMGGISAKCEAPLLPSLRLQSFKNSDETKFHMLPRVAEKKTTFITIGVGHDIVAEEAVRKVLGNNSIDFFGADPMVEINEKLYLTIGKFFPFAVGAKAGVSTASVLDQGAYINKQVVHLDAIYFFKHFVKRQFLDALWLDAEGAEYDLFPFFYKGGEFDKNGIVICQLNMEIHSPTLKQQQMTHDFLFKILEDERYLFVKIYNVGHLRTVFINFEDPKCAEKYLPL